MIDISTRSRWRYVGLLLLTIAVITLPFTCAANSINLIETAYQSSTFTNSIGVAVHLRYVDIAYGQYQEIVKPRLLELGVKHIRDGFPPSDSLTLSKVQDLAKAGIKSTLVIDPREYETADQAIPLLKKILDTVEAVEGPNELDLNEDVYYKGDNFPTGLRRFQTELYTAIKQEPATRDLNVIAPSVIRRENVQALGSVPCDLGNIHAYLGSHPTEPRLFQQLIPNAQTVCPNKPIVATEVGWHGAIDDPRNKGVSERTAGKLISRLWLEFFNQGIQRAFIYELIDRLPDGGNKENRFGLLRSDNSPKPAFTALKNMMQLLADTSSSTFTPDSLNYSLEGTVSNVHHTLLQKANRTFYLILWQEVPAFDQDKNDLTVPDQAITLTLKTPIRQAKTYLPLEGSQALSNWTNPDQITLQVPDHPLIVELTPA